MPKPRKELVSLDTTPFYHCRSRCVRRAFLCGKDSVTGNCYEHRRQFIEDKLLLLAKIFAIDICSYAIMSNHYHAVVFVDREQAQGWTDLEVAQRWHCLFKGTPLTQRFARGETLISAEMQTIKERICVWRQRLINISWLFRILNESIARLANTEDGCSGRFWEGRFKSDALLDEAALMTCMAYVDLNPVRTKMAKSPETSAHTSIKRRCQQAQKAIQPNDPKQQDKALLAFVGNPRKDMPKGLPFALSDYLELVDWTGRIIRKDKRGAIPSQLPPILERLSIEPKHWLYLSQHFESRCKGLVGVTYRVRKAARALGYLRLPGKSRCIEVTS